MIGVTSHSKIKLDAVQKIFGHKVVALDVKSDICPEQPFGITKTSNGGDITSTLACAKLRIDNIESNIKDMSFIVSIENGIVEYTNGIHYDICEVEIYDPKNNKRYTSCYFKDKIKISIPEFVISNVLFCAYNIGDQRSQLGKYRTAGYYLSKHFNTDPKDWMGLFGTPRSAQIEASLNYVKSIMDDNLSEIKSRIRTIPDFPKEGIFFQDMFSIFENQKDIDAIVSRMADLYTGSNVTKIVGPELRGCMLGVLVAQKMEIPFVPIRKPGKLPPPTKKVEYTKEYGDDAMELSSFGINENDFVVVVDDILATGGSLKACVDLVKHFNAKIESCVVMSDVPELKELAQKTLDGNYVHVIL